MDKYINKHLFGVGHMSGAQEPEFKILSSRSFVAQPMCQFSSTSAQQSGSFRVLKMSIPHGRTDI